MTAHELLTLAVVLIAFGLGLATGYAVGVDAGTAAAMPVADPAIDPWLGRHGVASNCAQSLVLSRTLLGLLAAEPGVVACGAFALALKELARRHRMEDNVAALLVATARALQHGR